MTILNAQEIEDLIMEKINELNKRVEIQSRQTIGPVCHNKLQIKTQMTVLLHHRRNKLISQCQRTPMTM